MNRDQNVKNFNGVMTTECCPHCDMEATIEWDVKVSGYKAFCPYCGEILMLCSECLYPEDNCDYSSKTNSCKHNPSTTPQLF
jgi:hypothetical protein